MKPGAKLFSVLETLCIDGEAGVTELSKKLGLCKSSIHRFLSVLVQSGYAEKNTYTGKYFPTLKVFEIGAIVRGRIKLVQVARPFMEELGKKYHETINLAFFEKGEVVYIDKVESVETLRMDLAVGRRVPAYCTALGKIFLANLPQEELERYFQNQRFRACTHKTITSAKDLKRELEHVKMEGFSIDDGELDEGIRCIAAPIRVETQKVVAALSIAGPGVRLSLGKLKFLKKPIITTTTEISRKLGYLPNRTTSFLKKIV